MASNAVLDGLNKLITLNEEHSRWTEQLAAEAQQRAEEAQKEAEEGCKELETLIQRRQKYLEEQAAAVVKGWEEQGLIHLVESLQEKAPFGQDFGACWTEKQTRCFQGLMRSKQLKVGGLGTSCTPDSPGKLTAIKHGKLAAASSHALLLCP